MTRPSMMTLLALAVCLCCSTAHGIDFITKDRFNSDAGGYKDYPFRVLFQKLAHSQGEEKKKIRTAIIEKQVFDRDMQRRVEAGTVSYQRTYGVVREISEERLVLGDAENETVRIFHTGLLAIPTLNPGGHDVSSFNLSRFAVVVHSLDDRVYQLEIGFPMAAPEDLVLSREGSRNLLQWAASPGVPKPVGYRVHAGDTLYQSDGTAIRIPRKPDHADEYTVRAVYRHGPVLVASAPSATLFDQATAAELAEKHQAEQAYALMLSTLNPASWESARQVLNENLSVFSSRLDDKQQAVVLGLSRFFSDITEGDRLGGLQPETEANLNRSTQYYEAAMEKGRHLAPTVDVAFIPSQKIQENQARLAQVAIRNRERLARDTLAEILAGLTPDTWAAARNRLLDQKTLLTAQLAGAELASVNAMLAFFSEIDAGDALARIAGDSPDQLSRAADFYRRARQKAAGAETVEATLMAIADKKDRAMGVRIAALRAQDRQAMARQAYDRVVADLTPDRWPEARGRLLSQRDLLMAGGDPNRRAVVEGLLRFFSDIDAGDRLSRMPSVTTEQMARAGAFYENARQTALALAPAVAVSFIADLKISQGQQLMDRMAGHDRARQIWAQVTMDLTPENWSRARQQLFDNREFLMTHMDPETQTTVNGLLAVFASIDAGDGIAGLDSVSPEQMAQAIGFYEKARQQAQTLAPGMAVGFIADMRISQGQAAMADIEGRARQALARQTLERILAEITPARWDRARQMLIDNRDMLLAHGTRPDQVTVQQLLAFLADMDRGDRFIAMRPPTLTLLENALSAYQSALAQADALSGAVDLSFLTQPKIEMANREKGALLAAQSKEQAERLYGQIVDQLTPSQWPSARGLMVSHGSLLRSSLDGEQRETLMALERFFSEIEEGDRLGAIRPRTGANLKNAAMFYGLAETKAAVMPPPVDVKFLPKMRLTEIAETLAAHQTHERRLAEQAAASSGEEPVARPGVTGKKAIKFAMKDFIDGNYTRALQGFSQVYHRQISMMRKRGMGQLQGVMGLPDRYRAEIVFLIELETVMSKSSALDEFAMEDAIQGMSNRILEGRGMWGVVSQDRRDKMANRLANITIETKESE